MRAAVLALTLALEDPSVDRCACHIHYEFWVQLQASWAKNCATEFKGHVFVPLTDQVKKGIPVLGVGGIPADQPIQRIDAWTAVRSPPARSFPPARILRTRSTATISTSRISAARSPRTWTKRSPQGKIVEAGRVMGYGSKALKAVFEY